MANVIFKDKKVNFDKLLSFGFIQNDSVYSYQTPIVDGQFQLKIKVQKDGQLETQVIDVATEDEYVLHLAPGASGEFVGQVSEAYTDILNRIKDNCFDNDTFKSQQAHELIQYIQKNYGDNLEFLWKKFPRNAIWRRADTNKWYGLLSVIPKSKMELESDEVVTVLDLRGDTTEIERIVDGVNFFPGYHMNKKSWYTIILDGSVSDTEIIRRLQASYSLAK